MYTTCHAARPTWSQLVLSKSSTTHLKPENEDLKSNIRSFGPYYHHKCITFLNTDRVMDSALGIGHPATCQLCDNLKFGWHRYQGPSPDEVALVEGARQLGFEFRGRTRSHITIAFLGHQVQPARFQAQGLGHRALLQTMLPYHFFVTVI